MSGTRRAECEALFGRWAMLGETVRMVGSIVQNECTAIPSNLPGFARQCLSAKAQFEVLILDTLAFCEGRAE